MLACYSPGREEHVDMCDTPFISHHLTQIHEILSLIDDGKDLRKVSLFCRTYTILVPGSPPHPPRLDYGDDSYRKNTHIIPGMISI